MNEINKNKNPTKEQSMDSIVKFVEKKLKDGQILNMRYGSEVAYQMILNYIKDGHDLEDVKSFLEKNLSDLGKKTMKNMTKK